MRSDKCFHQIILILLLLVFLFSSSLAEDNEPDQEHLQVTFQDQMHNITYQSFIGEDDYCYLFLPAGIERSGTVLTSNLSISDAVGGTLLNENTIRVDSDRDELTITDAQGFHHSLIISNSKQNCISIFLSDISLQQIHDNGKQNKYPNNTVFLQTEEELQQLNGAEIKGRGNFTWTLPKRSYQIRFPEKISPFGMEESKTWLLISNYTDDTFLRNKITLDLATCLGMEYTPDSCYTDLWIDGEYRGLYLLTEKIQIGENRVELQDEQGILVELDNLYYEEEKLWEETQLNETCFVLKDARTKDLEQGEESIARKGFHNFMRTANTFEEQLYQHAEWETVSSYIDVESFIIMYFIQELSGNSDGCRSSVFLYKDGESDMIHMGPPWDYDIAYGNINIPERGADPDADYIGNISHYVKRSSTVFTQLMTYPEFRRKVRDFYLKKLQPTLYDMDLQTDAVSDRISDSANMDRKRWDQTTKAVYLPTHEKADSFPGEVSLLKEWLKRRIQHLERRYNETFLTEGIPQIEDRENIIE